MDNDKEVGIPTEGSQDRPDGASAGSQAREFMRKMPVTATLLAMNVAAFVLSMLVPAVGTYGMLWPEAVLSGGAWWMLLTSMFLHGGIMHLACNMLSLVWLGPESEQRNGHLKFLILYLLGGIGGGLAHIAWEMHAGTGVPALGASGAIFALLGNYGYALLTVRKRVGAGKSPVLDRAWSSFAACLAINVVIGFSDPEIAMAAHVGGFVAGVLLALAFGAFGRNLRLIEGGKGVPDESVTPKPDGESES